MRYYEEDEMQMMYVRCFNECWSQYSRLLHHAANEGNGNIRRGARNKRMGVQAGFPDLMLHVARGGYHGFGIELKRKGGRQQPNQIEMQELLEKQGYKYVVCRSLASFMDNIEEYLGEKTSNVYWNALRKELR